MIWLLTRLTKSICLLDQLNKFVTHVSLPPSSSLLSIHPFTHPLTDTSIYSFIHPFFLPSDCHLITPNKYLFSISCGPIIMPEFNGKQGRLSCPWKTYILGVNSNNKEQIKELLIVISSMKNLKSVLTHNIWFIWFFSVVSENKDSWKFHYRALMKERQLCHYCSPVYHKGLVYWQVPSKLLISSISY